MHYYDARFIEYKFNDGFITPNWDIACLYMANHPDLECIAQDTDNITNYSILWFGKQVESIYHNFI
jgi:hypothetical protein